MEAAAFCREFTHSPALQRSLNRYLYVTLSQLAQTAARNCFYLAETHLARWLLRTPDRAHADEFCITHEFLAYMWACAARALLEPPVLCAKRKRIRYSRGGLINLDGRGLEAAACSCYAAVKETYTRVLS